MVLVSVIQLNAMHQIQIFYYNNINTINLQSYVVRDVVLIIAVLVLTMEHVILAQPVMV